MRVNIEITDIDNKSKINLNINSYDFSEIDDLLDYVEKWMEPQGHFAIYEVVKSLPTTVQMSFGKYTIDVHTINSELLDNLYSVFPLKIN